MARVSPRPTEGTLQTKARSSNIGDRSGIAGTPLYLHSQVIPATKSNKKRRGKKASEKRIFMLYAPSHGAATLFVLHILVALERMLAGQGLSRFATAYDRRSVFNLRRALQRTEE
jgi:hypothetical protein